MPTFRTRGSPFTFTKNTEVVVSGATPTNAGGAPDSTWAIHPAASLPYRAVSCLATPQRCHLPVRQQVTFQATMFTVWANNSAGDISTTISITVQDEAADISYARFTVHIHQEHGSRWRNTNQRWWCGKHMGNSPSSILLPDGLLFGTSNGTIYGTPTTGTSAIRSQFGRTILRMIFRQPFRSL